MKLSDTGQSADRIYFRYDDRSHCDRRASHLISSPLISGLVYSLSSVMVPPMVISGGAVDALSDPKMRFKILILVSINCEPIVSH